MEFLDFKIAVNDQFTDIAVEKLFVTGADKEELWDTYMGSFPSGTNPLFRERREHDCQCCKQFIRACGNVVAITPELELMSIWDVEIGGHYQVVADAMSKLVKSKAIKDLFIHYQRDLGTDFNHAFDPDNNVTTKWEHFYFKLPNKNVMTKNDIGSALSKYRSHTQVFLRGLEEITNEAVETVLELIDQDSLERGSEHRKAVVSFLELKKLYSLVDENPVELQAFGWVNSLKRGARIRNTVIGTLLMDLSEGVSLDKAVFKFEHKIDPTRFKRPRSLITKAMIFRAEADIEEIGYTPSLNRRNATLDDLTINNVLFANRDTKKVMSVFEEMVSESSDIQKFDKVEEVNIGHFLESILPTCSKVEVLFENQHENNLMSLVSPTDPDAPGMFKWGNNFSWAYNGDVADSMKQRVKSAGGKVDGDFRFSILWNDQDTKGQSDLDAWCIQPNGTKVYFSRMKDDRTNCNLDVDIQYPGDKVAVENIVIPELNNSHDGTYKILVHNYSNNSGNTGFKAEFECNSKVHSYVYGRSLRSNEVVVVAEFRLSKEKGVDFINSLPSTSATREIWEINTSKFQNVSMIMNSPNHWDGEETGNKHTFFMIEGCQSGAPVRGFFNEYLKESLTKHRKVFEVVGSKMKTEPDNQLCGLGFSSTKRNSLICKVTGSFSRVIKVNF